MTAKAFTLIEMVMYLALFSLLMGGVVSASYAFETSMQATISRSLLNEEEIFILNKIDFLLRGGTEILSPAAGDHSDTLILVRADHGRISISEAEGTLMHASLASQPLTSDNFAISSFDVIRTEETATEPEMMTLSFSIETKTRTGTAIKDIVSHTIYPNGQ